MFWSPGKRRPVSNHQGQAVRLIASVLQSVGPDLDFGDSLYSPPCNLRQCKFCYLHKVPNRPITTVLGRIDLTCRYVSVSVSKATLQVTSLGLEKGLWLRRSIKSRSVYIWITSLCSGGLSWMYSELNCCPAAFTSLFADFWTSGSDLWGPGWMLDVIPVFQTDACQVDSFGCRLIADWLCLIAVLSQYKYKNIFNFQSFSNALTNCVQSECWIQRMRTAPTYLIFNDIFPAFQRRCSSRAAFSCSLHVTAAPSLAKRLVAGARVVLAACHRATPAGCLQLHTRQTAPRV